MSVVLHTCKDYTQLFVLKTVSVKFIKIQFKSITNFNTPGILIQWTCTPCAQLVVDVFAVPFGNYGCQTGIVIDKSTSDYLLAERREECVT